jgi:hypothetical protein
MRRIWEISRAFAGLVGAVTLGACNASRSPTAVDTVAAGGAPVGTYDVVTTLTVFNWETAAPDPLDCPTFNGFPYCEHTRPPGGASLQGTFVVAGPFSQPSPYSTDKRYATTGTFSGRFCAQSGDQTPCVKMGDSVATQYADGTYDTLNPTYGFTLVELTGSAAFVTPYIQLSPIIIRGDSLFGALYWSMSRPSRGTTHYDGTFVAHRRP